ncbi:MAG: protein TolR [Oceanococcaceae bacterium]
MSNPARKRKLAHEINVVPYIDVMLVLLIIFMVTAPLLKQGIEVELPQVSSAPMSVDPSSEPLVVSVDADGRRYLNRGKTPEEPVDDDELLRLITLTLKAEPGLKVVVEGDRQARYEMIMDAMSLLQGAGVQNVGLATQPG